MTTPSGRSSRHEGCPSAPISFANARPPTTTHPESIDRTVIAANCSNCEPGLTINESAAVTAGLAAAAGGEEGLECASLRSMSAAAGCRHA
jgi:hypothetical protein